ncbi:glycosyltransferase, partial [Vibrio lentus]|uniref:glycosyltransferase n=1 Tax=Vibrio lentus TaxID=136468 RepID=UPI002469AE5C
DKIDEINNFYCPNAVDSDFFVSVERRSAREKLDLSFSKKYALFISGQNLYRPEKRYDLFKEVLYSYSEKYGVVIDEIALDNTSREELVLYYNAVDFYLLTSDFEGSPNAVKECLSCNTSVISRNVGSVQELLSGLSNSFVVDSEQPEDYHSSIKSVLTSPVDNNYRSKLKEKGLDKVFVANKLKGIYESI